MLILVTKRSVLGSLVGTRSLSTKVQQEKTAIKKNSTVSDKESNYLSRTVEFFLIAVFFLVNFGDQTPASELIKATVCIFKKKKKN